MADRLPKMKYCREFVKSNYLRDENGVYYIQDEIDRLTDALGCALQHLMESDDEAGWDEKIHMVQASTALYRMIYGDDLKFYHCRISWNAWLLSICLIAQDKKEETLASLEEMSACGGL